MTIFDDGTGPALFVGGDFSEAGGVALYMGGGIRDFLILLANWTP